MIVKVGGQLAVYDLLEDDSEAVGQVLVLGSVVLYERAKVKSGRKLSGNNKSNT